MKRRKGSISSRREQPGHTSKDYGASVCWRGVPEVEELWNTVLVTLEGRGFAGYARGGVERMISDMGHLSGLATNQELAPEWRVDECHVELIRNYSGKTASRLGSVMGAALCVTSRRKSFSLPAALAYSASFSVIPTN